MSQIVVEFQCLELLGNSSVSCGCEVPVSHMAVKFQCLAWRWISGVSNSCGIPVSHMAVDFHCLTWLWNSSVSTAMRYIGISQPCEKLEFHNHVRHWKMAFNTINQANNYLCNQCLSPLMLRVRISIRARCT